MKKLRILPGILMLTLCLGVLAVGIYAIKPTQNTIQGSISINSTNDEVAIVGYINDEEVFRGDSLRYGDLFAIPKEKLTINTENINTIKDVDDIILRINVKNKSNNALGVYFYNGTALPEDGYATEEHIAVRSDVKDENENLVADVFMDSYSYLAPNDDEAATNTNYDEVDMYAIIRIKALEITEQVGSLELFLNIEDYKATENLSENFHEATGLTDVGSPNISGFVKFPDDGSVTSMGSALFFNNKNIDYVVIPEAINRIDKNIFYMSSVKGICMPRSVTEYSINMFQQCQNLEYFRMHDVVTSIGKNSIKMCYNLQVAILSKNLTSIPEQLFYKTTSLTKLNFPNKITSIGNKAFAYAGIYEIDLSECAELTLIDEEAFQYGRVERVAVPSSIEKIGLCAFYQNPLIKVSLPDVDHRVTLDMLAFASDTSNISGVFYLPNNYELLGGSNGQFVGSKISKYKINADNNLYMEIGCAIYKRGSENPADEAYNTPVTFELYPSMSPNAVLNIPSTVTYIRKFEISAARYLQYINVHPDSTTYVSVNGVLYNKQFDYHEDGMYDVIMNIPNKYTLNGVKQESFVVPEGVTFISAGYHKVTVEETEGSSVGGFSMVGSNLKSISLPSSSLIVGTHCFAEAVNLESVNSTKSGVFDFRGMNIHSFGNKAFENCKKLETLVIGSFKSDKGNEQRMALGDSFVINAINLSKIYIEATLVPAVGYGHYISSFLDNFKNLPNDYVIYVPEEALDDYKTAWSDIKEHIQAGAYEE